MLDEFQKILKRAVLLEQKDEPDTDDTEVKRKLENMLIFNVNFENGTRSGKLMPLQKSIGIKKIERKKRERKGEKEEKGGREKRSECFFFVNNNCYLELRDLQLVK